MKFIPLFFLLSLPLISMSQTIKNGPMVGYSATRESVVWVQTDKECSVNMSYWDIKNPSILFESDVVKTNKEHGYTAHLLTNLLEPGNIYGYMIKINGKKIKPTDKQTFTSQKLWKWRGDAPDFDFVAGSCFYINETQYDRPGRPYGGEYGIMESIHKEKPDFMVWLGDNTYLREPDWDSKQGIYHRYTHTRSVKEMKALMASTHMYAIWDDHDYGPNDSEWVYYGKEWAKQAFKDFWANPVYGVGNTDGITGFFNWYDTDFFLMDNRWYRSPQKEEGHILGEKQLNWLLDALEVSTAQFKVVCIGGQVLNSVAKFENYAVFKNERDKLLSEIDKRKIKNVIFLDGDRHHSEISKWTGPQGTTIHDITSSSLTSGTGNNRDEVNENRIPNSIQIQKNYAFIEVKGAKDDRKFILKFKGEKGELLYEYIIEPQKK
jgi:alkaline phosphatase D